MAVSGRALAGLPDLGARTIRRYRAGGVIGHLLGAILRTRLQKAGVLILREPWPFPHVLNYGGRIEAENCAFFGGVRLECWRDAVLKIGNGTYLNRGVEIVAAQSVSIGRDCKIARDVIIMDTDQHQVPGLGLVARPVVIGDRVWIGARALILKGVSIGHDAIIGAGAVVTKDVPPHGVLVGAPSRLIRGESATEIDRSTAGESGSLA